ncbi:MAG: type II toxin-antitoxin system VapC family toxin [Methylocystis sp.]|nr:type II toxin-antitoxin system VapC family toxin [Methylocystis sp.]MBI3275584.1 type II toxin-antitoxin system VapC family toxin [Methylocystis sp.]
MSVVLDSSATLAYCFEDERTPAVVAIFEKVVQEGAVVPSLWRFEIANGLLVAQRRRRITPVYRREVFASLNETCIEMDEECERLSWSATIRLADLYGLTVYDAAYLELAQRRRLPLATLDAALARAAEAAGVEALG